MENILPFGGKTMIFGGDFRKVLSVVKRGSKASQIAASISRSTFWHCVQIIHLQENMRSAQDMEFSQFLLREGDGLQHTVNEDFIKLPDSIIIPWEGEQSIHQLIDSVFPNMIDHVNDANYMVGRAIITPKNVDVDTINELLIRKFPGEEREYTSWDSVSDDNHNLFQEEFLNSLSPSGLPPHRIILKVGSPIMLLRNVAPELGLCNGTILICRNLGRNFIDAEIITDPYKTQGQTIPNIGIFLRNHVFSNGQLYVALSRGVSQNSTKIFVKDGKLERRSGVYTRNVAFKDVLLPNRG
ncbi:uncharacterized protein [Henckelia pumila]|uniref:uncharacterized protein n=1 Tax=Henckelia pumila TaxID=405737 RepID=UPI003C6DE74C